ncbi:hypothetical protein KW805_04095 [Candidatus Pacearchaeota archaeon]|nr:hypothetical protein [Candidatus Pacearchaeota archaeon]
MGRYGIYEEKIAEAHDQPRRTIYDPSKLILGLENFGKLYWHNIIDIHDPAANLGDHYHEGGEVYWTPNGGIKVALLHLDQPNEEPEFYPMAPGSRLQIFPNVVHSVRGEHKSVLTAWGTEPYAESWIKRMQKENTVHQSMLERLTQLVSR